MALDVRTQCLVCAWRGTCNKKHTIREAMLHCPDFCRDKTLEGDPDLEGPAERHKRVDDVFGQGRR